MSLLDFPAKHTISRWWKAHQNQWLRFSIIVGVLLFSALFAVKLPEQYMRLILMLPLIVAGALILLHWPPLGILLVIVASLLVRINIPALGLTAALVGGLTGLWVIDMVARKQAISLIRSPVMPPLLLFTAVALLSFSIGQFPWYPISPAPMDAQLGGLGIFILSFCAFLLAAHQIRDIRWLKAMTYLFLGLGAVVVIAGLFPGIRQVVRPLFHRKILGGSLFWTWLVALSFSQALFNRKLNWRWRLLLGVVVADIFYTNLIQGRAWSSGWVPPVVVVIVIIWIGLPRIALPLTAVGSIVMLRVFQNMYDAIIFGDNEYSTITRLEAWRIVGEIVKVNPILGLGPANYRFYTPLFPILGWYVRFNSHNNYVDIAAQTGLLGLACFLWLMWAIGRLGWRLLPKVPTGGFEQAYVIACLGGFVGMLVAGMLGDWVLPFVYNIGIEGMRASVMGWLFLGGLVALDHIYKLDEPAGENTAEV